MSRKLIRILWRLQPTYIRKLELSFIARFGVSPLDYARPKNPGNIIIGGFMGTATGLGEGARRMAHNFKVAGFDVSIANFSNFAVMNDFEAGPIWPDDDQEAGVVILNINPDVLNLAVLAMGKKRLRKRHIIGQWAWELDVVPKSWIRALDQVDEVWVPTEFMATAIRKVAGNKPVHVVPYPVDVASIPTEPSADPFPEFKNREIVFFSYDVRSSHGRKNPEAVIEAFQRATRDNPSPVLIIKVHGVNAWPQAIELLKSKIGNNPNIYILQKTYSIQSMRDIMARVDIVVSLHHCEGYGFIMAEAMAAGKPVIATAWSGNVDFMSPDCSFLVNYKLVPVNDVQHVYDRYNAQWAEPDIDHAANFLRELLIDPAKRKSIGVKARRHIETLYSLDSWIRRLPPSIALYTQIKNRQSSVVENAAIVSQLEIIKHDRVLIAQHNDPSSSWAHRLIKRYRQMRKSHTAPSVWLFLVQRIVNKIWILFMTYAVLPIWNAVSNRHSLYHIDYFLKEKRKPGPGVPLSLGDNNLTLNSPRVIYAIKITGGIGDSLIIARMVRDLQGVLGHKVEFDVYVQSPEIVEAFFSQIPGFSRCYKLSLFHLQLKSYAFGLSANQFVTFIVESMKRDFVAVHAPEVIKIFNHVEKSRDRIEKYIRLHPTLDGAFSDLATLQGHKRYTYLHTMLGIAYGGHRLPIAPNTELRDLYGLKNKTYITIHDGWDNTYKLVAQRPTKVIPPHIWKNITHTLKLRHPNIMIVQLGGKSGADIPETDVNLRNKISFLETTTLLAGSSLHLDTESGLVHVCSALGVKSLVMFGPTSVDWFSYPDNINVSPSVCGNCWWSTDTWMDSCPLGQTTPVCLSTLDYMKIVDLASNHLLSLSNHSHSHSSDVKSPKTST